jgi:glycosyltransferase involved in cell wall biosynthesis
VVYPASRFRGPTDLPIPENIPPLPREQFWLNVGVLEPRKNHLGLLRAYAALKADLKKTFPLVIAGGQGWLMNDFEKQIDALNLKQNVILLGYVEEETLKWLYQNCFAFVYPTLFEGFGLPVLEAMSLGAPVVTSNVSSIPEVVGEAGVMVDPLDEKALYGAMSKLVMDAAFCLDLKNKAIRQASKFSWESAARTVLEAYKEVLSRERLFFEVIPKGT